jgi:hypothetical protein
MRKAVAQRTQDTAATVRVPAPPGAQRPAAASPRSEHRLAGIPVMGERWAPRAPHTGSVERATAAMEASPANSHPAAAIVYGSPPPIGATPKRARNGNGATLLEVPGVAAAPNAAELPALPERHRPPADRRDQPKLGVREPERSSIPVELPSVEPAGVQERPTVSAPHRPPRATALPALPDLTRERLEHASRLAHAGPARAALNRFEHGDTPSGLGQTTTRAGELARLFRAGDGALRPLSSSVVADAHFKALPDPKSGSLRRHASDSAAHVSNAVGLVSRPEHAVLVAHHLANIVADEPIDPAAHHSDDHRRALSACVHVTGAALELAHAREAAENNPVASAAYHHVARPQAQALLGRHGLGDNEHVKAAFEADDDPEKRKALRDRLDAAHGRAHLAYAQAVRVQRGPPDSGDAA